MRHWDFRGFAMDEKKRNERKINIWVIILSISCVTLLELIAILKGIDGKFFATAIGAICVLAGVVIPKLFNFKVE